MSKRKTTEDFIKQAVAVHGDTYDYSGTEYIGANTKVKVVCKIHGEFNVFPNNHLRGAICFKCSYEASRKEPKDTQEYIKQATEIHGDRYDYSRTTYSNAVTKLLVTCREHGDFEVLPNNHLKSHCKKCAEVFSARLRRRTIADFVNAADIVYGGLYDYTKSKYKGNHSKLTITCRKHGDFIQTASAHLAGYVGCTMCVKENMRSHFADSSDEFIEKARRVHGNKYNYSLVDYTNNAEKVTIICPEHGEYRQTPSSHLKGSSCPSCAKTGFDKKKRGFVYILESMSGLIKIGITNNAVNKRIAQLNKNSTDKFSAVYYKSMKGDCAVYVESRLLSWLKTQLTQPTHKFSGYTECFNKGNVTFPNIVDKLIETEEEFSSER